MRNRRDIYLRAHTELHREQETKPRKRKDKAQLDKWPEKCLIFDTETRTCMEAGCNGVRYQQLMFGIYRVCKLVEGRYICESEGIFYSSSEEDSASSPLAVLEKSELNAIGTFVLNNFADIEVKQFPPKVRLAVHQSYPEFMNKVFWPAVRKGYLIVGFNLPFDLSRLSLGWNEHRKGGFSLIMSLWFNPKTQRWEPHSFRPTIHIRPKDAKTSFISRSSIRKKHARKEWPNPGRFLDLYTLLYSLFDMHMGLDVWCSYFRKKGYEIIHRTVLHEPRGRVEKDELIQCREDVKRTHQLLNAAMQEFNIHSLPSLSPDRSYSPAVIAKGYMREMRIELPKIKFKETVTNEINGIAMQTYYGGRSEVHIRRIAVPVMRLDFTSCYCTVNTLLRNWDVLTADSVEFPVCTDEIRDSLNSITLDKCFDLALWPQLRFFALIEPDHDIFPIRAAYNERDKDKFNIGLNYLTSKQPVWFSGPDIIASILLNKGKVPKILKAFRLVPSEKKQEGLKLVQLLGEVHIDPCVDDFYKFTVEQKQATKDETLKKGLKCIGNAGAYGPLVQLNRDLVQFRRYDKKTGQKISLNPKLDVYSGEHFHQQNAPKEIEVSGPFYFPPVAALITAGSRLLLALAERCVEDAGGQMVFCDTDSLCIVSNDKGGRVPASCNDFGYTEGADPREFDPIPCLKRETVIAISKRFEFLNPYSFKGTILKVEDVNFVPDKDGKPTSEFRDLYAYAISAKRYVLFEGRHVRNIVDAKAHGIGYLMSPIKRENDSDRFVMEFWQKVLENEGVSYKSTNPKWLDLPAEMKIPVSSPAVLGRMKNFCKPYDFLISPVVRDEKKDMDKQAGKPILITAFTKNSEDWPDAEYFNVRTGKAHRITTTYDKRKGVPVRSYREVLNTYVNNYESKFNGADGKQCTPLTRGVLQRMHVEVSKSKRHKYCGKEFKRKLEKGLLDHETDFKCTVYENDRVSFDESTKAKMRQIGLRELRRNGIGRGTIERALHSKIKKSTAAKILAAIESYEKTINELEQIIERRKNESA